MESDTNDARPAMHHLSLHAEQYLSQSQIIQRLEGLETSTLATLTLSYAELKDVKTIGILDWLSQAGRKSVQPRWICKAIFDHFNSLHPQSESDQDGASNDPEPEMISFTPRLPSLPHYTPSTYPIRKLDLTSNNITSKGLDSISDYLAYNSCINILSLQANSIGLQIETETATFESNKASLIKFARSVSTSTLRQLNLASNPLGSLGLKAFLTSLSSNSLKELDISTTIPSRSALPDLDFHHEGFGRTGLELPKNKEGKTMTEDEEGVFISRIISKFLRPIEEMRVRNDMKIVSENLKIGDRYGCSKLEKLKLNGNHLGWEGVRMIVGTIVGSSRSSINVETDPKYKDLLENSSSRGRSAQDWMDQLLSKVNLPTKTTILQPPKTISNFSTKPNRSLMSLELYATGINESKTISRVKSIGSLMLESRRQSIRQGVGISIDGMRDNRQDPHLISEMRNRGRGRRNSNPTSSTSQTQDSIASAESNPEVEESLLTVEELEELKFGHITKENWKRLLGSRVWANDQERIKTQKVSGELLGLVRILGSGVVDSETQDQKEDEKKQSLTTLTSDSVSSSYSSSGVFPIKKLPSELRVSILREIDTQRILSNRQFLKIIDYGVDRRTIGLGSFPISSSTLFSSSLFKPSSDSAEPTQTKPNGSLLPFEMFSLIEVALDYRGSLPHFYHQEAIDSATSDNRRKEEEEEEETGGGGPDGAGGVLDRRIKVEIVEKNGEKKKVWRKRKGLKRSERRCFFEMTGCDVFEV